MANIENITDKLIKDADEKIDKIFSDAREEAELEKETIINNANKKSDKILEDSKKEAEKVFNQKISAANLSRRDSKIQAKQNYIDRVFQLAVERLNNISNKEFLAQVKSVTDSINGNYELLVPRDRVDYLKSKGINVSSENVEDGFVVRTENVDYNNRYKDLVESYKKDLIGEISQRFLNE